MFVVFATQEPPKIHKTKPAAIQHGEQGMTGSPVYRYQNSNFARPSHLLGRGRAGYETREKKETKEEKYFLKQCKLYGVWDIQIVRGAN